MKILFISDTHALHQQLDRLPEADLFICGGDVSKTGARHEIVEFCSNIRKFGIKVLPLYEKAYNLIWEVMILEVTSSDFRKDFKTYFDAVSEGTQVIIKRGRKAFTLVPVNEDDLYFTPEMIEKIKRSKEQIERGKCVTISSVEELRNLLDKKANVQD